MSFPEVKFSASICQLVETFEATILHITLISAFDCSHSINIAAITTGSSAHSPAVAHVFDDVHYQLRQNVHVFETHATTAQPRISQALCTTCLDKKLLHLIAGSQQYFTSADA